MRTLSPLARRYLMHAALLTFGLAVSSLFYNLLLVALGYDRRTLALPLLGPVPLLGLLNSLPVLVAGLGSLPLWLLVSRVGPRAALLASALLYSCSLAGTAFGSEPLTLLVAACIGGPASVLFQVSAAPFMMRHSSAAERDALFAFSAALNIGVAGLGSLLGGLLPGAAAALFALPAQSAASYRVAFVIAALLVLLSTVPLLGRREQGTGDWELGAGDAAVAPRRERAGSGVSALRAELAGQLRIVLRSAPAAARFMVSPLLISCGASLLIPFLNLYFRQRFGASDAALGLIFAAIGVATGAATLAGPLLSRRLGKIGSVILTQALAIPCLLLLGVAPVLWLAASVALLRGALMNMASPLYDAYAMEASPEAARPMVIGLINGAFAAGYVIGPTISAEVQLRFGFAPLFAITAALYTLAAAANYLLLLRPRRARPLLSTDT